MLPCSVGFAQTALAQAAEPPAGSPVDVSAVQADLVVSTDGKGHFLAAIPHFKVAAAGGDSSAHNYYSPDGKRFVALRVTGGAAMGAESFDRILWEPRVQARWQGAFGWKQPPEGAGWWVQCGDRKTSLTELSSADRAALLAKAQFVTGTWDRRAYALARDNAGVYWYVDRGVGEKSKQFRVFMGVRGQMKPVPLVNVVSDSEGDVFATKQGTLRLVLGKGESLWAKGKAEQKLILLPIEDNRQLIYTDLGPYLGQRLGTPCDDL